MQTNTEVKMPTSRDRIVSYLGAQLVGPVGGPAEIISDPPHQRYIMGTLYPQNTSTDVVNEEGEELDTVGAPLQDEAADDPVGLSGQWMPSSLGVSFLLSPGAVVECEVTAARYEQVETGGERRWQRVVLADSDAPAQVRLAPPTVGTRAPVVDVLDNRAYLHAVWRTSPGGHLVTVTLVNAQTDPQRGEGRVQPELCLCQVSLQCKPVNGEILPYPRFELLAAEPEEQELQILYRNTPTYAIGHGCAANWEEKTDGIIVYSTVMPRSTVPALTPAVAGSAADVLSLSYLANSVSDPNTLVSRLSAFVDGYQQWLAGLPAENTDIPAPLHPARDRLLKRIEDAAARMNAGIELLRTDATVRDAFGLANRAMLMQMCHSASGYAGSRVSRDERPYAVPDYSSAPDAWYPFQLAFQLLTLASIADPASEDRHLVDLLWFPTGGGKTEAYLALAAFQIFHRRLVNHEAGAGTTVITRYTLRLLTAQQFQRAATLICACELLRRDRPELGPDPITIGLWVGGDASPNRFNTAAELYNEMLEADEPQNPFQLDQCPWCGTEIIPAMQSTVSSDYGVRADGSSFRFFCPSTGCPFHDELPVNVVDEHLYRYPPTLLIATADKFARLTWEEKAGEFFGGPDRLPPSLIIQDELHLISGPLGTVFGLYEAAIDALIGFRGPKPKVIASTATIRRAGDQVRALFDAPVDVFPPAGLRADDSFFARVDQTRPGRQYVGVLAPGHTPITALVHTSAALAQAPVELGLGGDELDAYWTQVIYHNSLRELGKTFTMARDDIPKRIEQIATDQARARSIRVDDILELTSNIPATEIPERLARLSRRCTDSGAVPLVVCTNMLSVGVDVKRLSLMLVNGQPKTTSEYIQASSRVGRHIVPGLVVALYSGSKPRDRSHYETFRPYHSALYRAVEPTSVTPFSAPARERALHAALVILVRHAAGLRSNDSAAQFAQRLPKVQEIIDAIRQRVRNIDELEEVDTISHINRLVAEWEDEVGQDFKYYARGRQFPRLLRNFGEPGPGWETLQSMRNVDRECRIGVMGERP